MSEHHHHDHHHHHVSGKNLFITIILNVVITLSQIVGGIFSGSLALLSDALHNFSDVVALVIAYIANRLTQQPNSESKTFGYKRAEILAALFNASLLMGIGLFLIIESIEKFNNPEVIDSTLVIGLGLFSILLNALSVLLIKDDADHNMNIKAAYLHLLTDVMTSVAVVVGGLLMYYFELFWIDPLVSILIALYLMKASFALVMESSAVLMQFAPKSIDMYALVDFIESEEIIENVHHIHLWRLNDKEIHLEAHLDFKENITIEDSNRVVDTLAKKLHKEFSIEHTTFQCEFNHCDDKSLLAKN